MTISNRLPGASMLALALGCICAPQVHAQDSGDAETASSSGMLDEIVVTARRVAENMQNVPVAVTSFSGTELARQNAVAVPDVARLTPGFVIKRASSTPTAVNLQIRGQYQSDVLATLDPSVGTYVDGYYWARAYGLSADLLDVRSVQVLRGPQGTLFGRNTTGGALVLETNDPDADTFSGMVSATYGRFNERSATAVLNLPLIPDRLAVRGAFIIRKRDGYIRELTSGKKVGEQDSWTGRVKLLAKPADNLRILLSAERYETDAMTQPYRMAFVAESSPSNLEAAFDAYGPGAAAERRAQGIALIRDYQANVLDKRHVALNEVPVSKAKTETYTGTVTLDTFFGAVKAITGYRRVRADAWLDLDGSPFQILRSDNHQDLDQFSGEFQITGSTADRFLDFVAGAFYFEESGYDWSTTTALPHISPNPNNISDGTISHTSQGVYGQVTAHVTDRFSLTGGLRYSVEDKALTIRNRRELGTTGVYTCNVSGATPPPDCAVYRKDAFDGVSYTFGADYKLSSDILLYAKTSKGFRSGGQNLRAQGASGAAFIPFNPEVSREHEIGLKSEFLDRRVRFNLAGFYSRVSDIQRSTLVTSSDPVTGQVTTATIVGNAGKVRIYGGEAELTARVADGLTLGANGAMIRPRYLEYVDPYTGADRRGERFEQVPRWTFSMNGSYEHEFDIGRIMLRADYSWQSATPLSPYNDPADPDNDRIVALTTARGGQMNARVAWEALDRSWEVALFGRNLFNREDVVGGQYLTPPLSSFGRLLREPVTYGLTATFRFGGQ
ncbi:MAG: TonB-dependent receptor [Novosphingobium sp.]|nr:TonB-dependent receptor [Novosphingobium sp.]